MRTGDKWHTSHHHACMGTKPNPEQRTFGSGGVLNGPRVQSVPYSVVILASRVLGC